MINVENINPIDRIYTNDQISIININELPYFDLEQYDFNDSKSFAKYISDLERIVRNSFEYRQFIYYLRNTEGMSECSVLENVSNKSNAQIKIEIHHSPFTLYDICTIVFKKRSSLNESLNINAVAEEILYLHYIGWVGLIPLSATVHDMVHNSYVFIPTNKIRGFYRQFIESYYNYINPDLLDCIDAAEKATKEGLDKKRKELFNNHRIYVNANGSYELPENKRLKEDIKIHIDDVKNKK